MNSKKNYSWVLVSLCLMMSYFASGQSETEFYSDGIVIPKVSVKAVANPIEGQIIYDTNSKELAIFNGTIWLFSGGQGFWERTSHGISFDGTDNVGIGVVANSATKLFVQGNYDEDPFRVQIGRENDPNGGDTKMRILAKYNSIVLGSSWNSIDSSHLDALWSNYKKNYFRDSLQLRNPSEDPALLMTKGSGLTIFDTGGDEVIELDRTGLATLDDLSVSEQANFGKGLITSDPIKLREIGNGPAGPEIQFMDDNSTTNIAAAIKVTNSTGGGNDHNLRIENRSVVGDINFSLDGVTNFRMNDAANFSYVDLAPWLDNTTDLGLASKRWSNIYTEELDVDDLASLHDLSVSEEASFGKGIISSDPIKIREIGNGPAGPEIQFMKDNSTAIAASSIKVTNSSSGGNSHTMIFNNAELGSMVFNPNSGNTNFRMRGNINESFVTLAPVTSNNIDLGTNALRWRTIYSQNILNTSDLRLKKNVTSLDNSVLLKLLKLNATSYNYKTDEPGSQRTIGFIAQDVEKIDPDWVVPPSNEDDHYLINYDNFTVLAIKAIQEQQELIFSLQEEVKNIKRELRK